MAAFPAKLRFAFWTAASGSPGGHSLKRPDTRRLFLPIPFPFFCLAFSLGGWAQAPGVFYFFPADSRPAGPERQGEMPLAWTTGNTASLWFSGKGMNLQLTKDSCDPGAEWDNRNLQGGELPIRMETVSPTSKATGATPYFKGRAKAVVHLLIGDASQWQTGLATYQTLVYPQVWPGIDMEYHAGEQLELRFELDCGANPSDILMATGASRLAVDGEGALWAYYPHAVLRLSPPLAFQRSPEGIRPVPIAYLPSPGGKYGFALGPWDPGLPLTIDPVLSWSSLLGDASTEIAYDVGFDGANQIYLTGQTGSPSFPTLPGSYDTSYNGGNSDVFISKFSAEGDKLLFSTFVGGSGFQELGREVAVDSQGNIFVAGTTSSWDFPTTQGSYDPNSNGESDAFLLKLSQDGSQLLFSTFVGGSQSDSCQGLSLDRVSGETWITGSTYSSNFPISAGAFDTSYNGGADFFVARISSEGDQLLFSTYLGGSQDDFGYGVVHDENQNVLVVGTSTSPDMPSTPLTYDPSFNGLSDVYLAKLDQSGSSLVGATFLGGGQSDEGLALTLAGDVFVAGYTNSGDFPTTPGALDTAFNGFWDVFIARISSDLSTLSYGTFLGGSDIEYGFDIAVNGSGEALVCGIANLGFPTTSGALDTSYNGGADAYFSKLSADGSALLYSTFIGGSATEYAYGLAVNPHGDVCVTGYTFSPLFPTTGGAFDESFNGEGDAFLVQFFEPCRNFVGSSEVDWADFLHLIEVLWWHPYDQVYDINRDGAIDVLDAILFAPCLP